MSGIRLLIDEARKEEWPFEMRLANALEQLAEIIPILHERIQCGGPTNYLDGDWYLTADQCALVRSLLADKDTQDG